jgi:hypothetical protein
MSRLLDRLNAASGRCPRSAVLPSAREPVEDAINELLTKVRVIAGERDVPRYQKLDLPLSTVVSVSIEREELTV